MWPAWNRRLGPVPWPHLYSGAARRPQSTVRIANRGKSGGGRAIYLFLVTENAVIMLMAYAKSEKDDLSADDRKAVLGILKKFGA